MKAILINSPVVKIVEEYDAPLYPHIGLGYVATYARKNDIPCDVIDCKLERMNLQDLLSRMEKYRDEDHLVIGFTGMTHEIARSATVAQEVKEHFPNTTMLIGGVHVTALPPQTLEDFPVFDVAVPGEGEEVFCNVYRAIQDKTTLKEVTGICYRDNGEILTTEKSDWINDLDAVGYPDWTLFPRVEHYPINIGRGCPIPCNFCARSSGEDIRFRSIPNIIEELDQLEAKYNAKYVHFFTDDFDADKRLTGPLLDAMIEKKYDFKWRCGMRVTRITMDVLKKMKQANCEHIEIGVESGNKDMLQVIKKGITLRRVESVVQMAKEIDLDVWCYFILGHPRETWRTAMDTINFMSRLNPTNAAIGIMVPYPGTEIWDLAKKGEGGYRLLSTDWNDFNKQIGNALELDHLTRFQLEVLQLYGYVKLFVSNLRVLDFAKFCLRYHKEGFAAIKNMMLKVVKKPLTSSKPVNPFGSFGGINS